MTSEKKREDVWEELARSMGEDSADQGMAELDAFLDAYSGDVPLETSPEVSDEHDMSLSSESTNEVEAEPTEEDMTRIFDEAFGPWLSMIRDRSSQGVLVTETMWIDEGYVPEAFTSEEFTERTISYLEDEDLTSELEFTDIARLSGEEETYYYSTEHMSENYARMAFLGAEKNNITTFVETVRAESKIYPRPLIYRSLMNHPLDLSIDQIDETFEAIQAIKEFEDIHECFASNGDRYFYSTLHLSSAQALAIGEWNSVERHQNP